MSADTAEVDTQYPEPKPDHSRLQLSDMELLLRLRDAGKTQVEIADILKCSQSTVARNLAKLTDTPQVVQALMKAESIGKLKDWKRASRIAAKRGDHRPAREWLEAAHPELRPQQGNGAGGGGVTVVIGMPGSPVELPSITIQPLASTSIDTLSLVPRNELPEKFTG